MYTEENHLNIPTPRQKYPDMPNIVFGEEGVRKLLANINTSKASGPDMIPARFIKETADQLARVFTHLYQQSYDTGHVPSSWTHALVCPVYKKSNISSPENYRPISLTAIPCKLMEHILVSKIWEHYNKHHVITSNQHGFRSGMSCETQLIEALHDWTSVLNKGQGQVDVIVLDFSKAFDTVPFKRLLRKLGACGVNGHTKEWIKGFLTSRTQEVVVDGAKSNSTPVSSGVPQGTVLGPLLFLTYINDIDEDINSKLRLFADDSAIYREINTLTDAHDLQRDLFKLQEWSHKWQMKFNIAKCKILRITRKRKNKIRFNYTMWTSDLNSKVFLPPSETTTKATQINPLANDNTNFSPLEEIQHDKYLGVIIDNKLSFNEHVDYITNKATKLLNLCRRNLYMCSKEVKETAYKSIVRPHLEYASSAWSPHTVKNIEKIEKVQRRSARFVLGNYNYGPCNSITSDIQNILKWPSLHHRRIAHDIHLMHKITNCLVNIQLPAIIHTSAIHPARFLHVQALHSEAFKHSYFVRTIRIWNKLPASLYDITSFPSFKSQATEFINSRTISKINNIWTV